MTIDEAKKLFRQAHQDYMTLPSDYHAPKKYLEQWQRAKQIRNEIYQQFGDQVLDWRNGV
jgi:hypothetical protein